MLNVNSTTWLQIKSFATEEIEIKRQTLESPNCPDKTADIMRGYILAYGEILGLPDKEDIEEAD
jgi:hypothetical protein